MRPFDLEAAKNGALFKFRDNVENCRYIGIHSDGRIVYESSINGIICAARESDLRMAPRKVVKYAVIDITTGKLYTNILNNSPQNTCVQSLVCATVTWEE